MHTLNEVLEIIRPTAEYVIRGGVIEWLDKNQSEPTPKEIEAGKALLESRRYREQRRVEYPALSEFADAYVHEKLGNSLPMQEYIAKCVAVKNKFPKGE